MLIVERQEKILRILRDSRTAQLEELARRLSVSASTVRRDLESLESRGLVERTHGGAIYRGPEENGPATVLGGQAIAGPKVALTERMDEHVDQKKAIGAHAASLVEPNMTLLLDGGSSVIYAAMQIVARPLQVVTNSLAVANLFHDDEQVELLLVGGSLYPRTGVTVGPIATGTLADLHADMLLFSVAGIYGDAAFNINLAMAQTEQAMMRQAAQSILLMDSGKFGHKSLTRVCGLGEIEHIITDTGVEQAWSEQLGDRLILAR